ncbi:hypothetical protein [Cellulomonas sp. Marseille-Q8402]
MQHGGALGTVGLLLLVTGCARAAEPTPPDSWREYDTLDALAEDAALVVTGVAQRQAGTDERPLVQLSVTSTLAGAAPADDPIWLALDPAVPLELHPGFRYVLYLEEDVSGSYTVVGPGAFEQPPGATSFSRIAGAPDGLPGSVTLSDVDRS